MEKLESLKNEKFESLTADDMNNIHGGGIWSTWKYEIAVKNINEFGEPILCTTFRRYNWFGLHATAETTEQADDPSLYSV
ncbi:MAG: hypothetical protein LBQ22_13050 [Bacteroidales bacterium]|jgi:hypothetical protein|nr:hypothetical protein [Bacteroidales bacterium]